MSTTSNELKVAEIASPTQDDQARITRLEEELKVQKEERENVTNRLIQSQIELVTLRKNAEGNNEGANPVTTECSVPVKGESQLVHSSQNPIQDELEKEENQQLRSAIANLKILVKEKTTALSRQVLQTQALETQVSALKEVTSLTKGMLNIRNTENEKLKEQIDLMQKKVDSERARNNAVLKKTELASSLNNQLRQEYLKQVKLFGELKEKYEKKINILTEEVARLNKEKLPLTNGDDTNAQNHLS